MLTITNGFDKLSGPDLYSRSQQILDAMATNPHFPDPTPTLATLTTKLTEFRDALSKAADGTPSDKAVRNQKRAELINLLHALGCYVLYTAQNDRAIALSSGYRIGKEQQPTPPLQSPRNMQVADGPNRGELKAAVNRVIGAKTYLFNYAQEPISDTTVWNMQPETKRKTVLRNLESGKRYWVKVGVVGVRGQLLYSDAVSRIVQ
ncbi:MAG: hypothetical protein M3342_06960 [Bacteroidota bacterium]|nr:hypothetical protein [Flavisolibacter sp.]MBD0350795.1 hypothetical protein [Flavisolibacter sp.]MDQ3843740.1 hypothetical protein [Bacteroidota bacterium]